VLPAARTLRRMAKLSTFRARRRSAAEKHALLPLQREIGSIDRLSRRKYVQEFTEAYQSYERVISKDSLLRFCADADTLLVSDFHALDSCQFFLCETLEELTRTQQRPLVLLLEAIFTRDQHIVDEWQADVISDGELRQRLRFDLDWGYEWEPFLHTLKLTRELRIPIYGADCAPRGNMRRISQRDRHAADAVARARRSHPDALLVVLFGESHLAPNHLPREVSERMPAECVRTVLQNVDALYFHSAGELHQQIAALRVDASTAAVFNATPIEKWQSYRLWIARWREESRNPDFTPALYDLIDALLAFLHIGRYPDNDVSSRYFIDCYPEVANVSSLSRARALIARKRLPELRRRESLAQVIEHGSCYIPELNLLVVHRLRMQAAAKDVSCFVHHACRDFRETAGWPNGMQTEERFYARVLEYALVDFGARVLYPSRPVNEEDDLCSLYSQAEDQVEAGIPLSTQEHMRILDCVMLHRDYELHSRSYATKPALLQEFLSAPVMTLEVLAKYLGELLGSDLYRSYIAGRTSRRETRSLFFRNLAEGDAREIYFATVRRVRQGRADLLAA
jgi:uncharacterized iron-regulated protein